jgi:putative ABC transport system ATP-binding protein
MEELAKLNQEGTTILLVTHDVKVAAKTDKVFYIMDGNIQGEYSLGKLNEGASVKERERLLNNWLMELGW